MSFVPHISVTTKPGHEEGASVSVSFVKTILGSSALAANDVEIQGRNLAGGKPFFPHDYITDERPGPGIEDVSAEIAHGVAKLMHETLELEAKLREEDAGKAKQEVDSFLGDTELPVGDQRMGAEDHEGDAQAFADAKNYNEQQAVTIAWYERLVHSLTHRGFVPCVHCKARPEWPTRDKDLQYVTSSNCIVCGGSGYLERREDGSMVKVDPDEEPTGPRSPLQPSGAQFEYVEAATAGGETELQSLYGLMTNRAMDTITLATKEAGKLKLEFVGTEELLFALAKGGNSVAATALHNLKIDLAQLAAHIHSGIEEGKATELPVAYTPQAKAALLLAPVEMAKMGHTRVGTEHILLGLMLSDPNDSAACGAIRKVGVDPAKVVKEIYDLLGYTETK